MTLLAQHPNAQLLLGIFCCLPADQSEQAPSLNIKSIKTYEESLPLERQGFIMLCLLIVTANDYPWKSVYTLLCLHMQQFIYDAIVLYCSTSTTGRQHTPLKIPSSIFGLNPCWCKQIDLISAVKPDKSHDLLLFCPGRHTYEMTWN